MKNRREAGRLTPGFILGGKSMEIRKLKMEELEHASHLLQYSYECSVLGRVLEGQEIFFNEYVDPTHLKTLAQEGSLILWGLWDRIMLRTESGSMMRSCLLAISAMTIQGQITLLYVHPKYQNRRYGASLLDEMRRYAGTELVLDRVWCNAAPAWTASYFVKRGFSELPYRQPMNRAFVTMQAKTYYLKEYEKKQIPKWVSWLAMVGSVAAALLVAVVYLVSALF